MTFLQIRFFNVSCLFFSLIIFRDQKKTILFNTEKLTLICSIDFENSKKFEFFLCSLEKLPQKVLPQEFPYFSRSKLLGTDGKPSTRLPPGRLVEHSFNLACFTLADFRVDFCIYDEIDDCGIRQ